ncbi:adenylate/guanylate cyclase domain-containing protein [Conexibacter stalactiti]|uniref:Adenylate/guanylate cyclase domain-containing protein n=1 Tax=Conexibacter stalactiti TaxID=1940611 RepID=A0ABU4HXI5_9ACTN|nr:adenylate/guanylate cyclase domain-containing protein [Conexibacter stalactiti]MDW5598037.1 adenylate/guanylate cyclase domain-containing protein [Conexibacter stalactiti]MEC5038679.1 adenylate/guanylate cyclase domain-containing protein [Conexibacter stalactiti]
MTQGVRHETTALPLEEAARRAGVAPATLRRWVRDGLVPLAAGGAWTPAAAAQARIVARLRERGHSLADIRRASDEGRLAFGYVEELFPAPDDGVGIEQAAAETGLEPALVERILTSLGHVPRELDHIPAEELALLRRAATALDAGFPLVALLQLVRVYGQALAQIADAEVRLFHLYVHEPLMRDGVPGLEVAEQMEQLARGLLPIASPLMDHVHRRFLRHFVEQDVIGHMETAFDGTSPFADLGRLRVAVAFADLAGYTRLTEEVGEEEAVDAVERFVGAVEMTLPEDARIIKTIGDAVMVVGADASALVDWAVGFQQLFTERPRPRIGLHHGETLYREGDYYGREVNLAARVAARSGEGEVLVTREIVELAGAHLLFEPIGEVRLKGFSDSTELFLAHPGPA